MIIVRLMGGMGNQMFQYAVGRHLALKNNTELKLDLSFLQDRRPRKNFVFRDYDLDIFDIKASVAEPQEIISYNRFSGSRIRNISSRLLFKLFGSKYNVIEEAKGFELDQRALMAPDNSYLIGYWQCFGYFSEIDDIIKKDFRITTSLSDEASAMADKIGSCNSVCINVRRTDFLTSQHGTCGLDYYSKGVEMLSERVGQLTIFVFSDDLDWCRENLKFHQETVFVGKECAGKKFDNYIELMRRCKHFIIPNSTFAWWAAWLCDYPGKIVISPKNWAAGNDFDASSLLLPEWLKI
jgi:hypothetical protein